jgi:hypothetical protein
VAEAWEHERPLLGELLTLPSQHRHRDQPPSGARLHSTLRDARPARGVDSTPSQPLPPTLATAFIALR